MRSDFLVVVVAQRLRPTFRGAEHTNCLFNAFAFCLPRSRLGELRAHVRLFRPHPLSSISFADSAALITHEGHLEKAKKQRSASISAVRPQQLRFNSPAPSIPTGFFEEHRY